MEDKSEKKKELESRIVQLKSTAYDVLAQLEYLQRELGNINKQIQENDQELKKVLLQESKS